MQNSNNHNSNVPHKQHYVPQRYLANWLDGTELSVLDLKGRKIRKYGTAAICFGKDFYKLTRLHKDEQLLLNKLFQRVPDQLKAIINELIMMPFCDLLVEGKNEEITKQVAIILAENLNEIEKDVFIRGGESCMGSIESSISEEMWQRIYSLDETILNDEQSRCLFFNYVSAQMWRIPKRKDQLSVAVNQLVDATNADISIDRVFPYFVFIQSMIDSIILSNNNSHKIVYLRAKENHTKEFLTSDNPIINICQETDSEGYIKNYDLFWPLNPETAMLITTDQNAKTRFVSDLDVFQFNTLICKQAKQYLISQKQPTLEEYL